MRPRRARWHAVLVLLASVTARATPPVQESDGQPRFLVSPDEVLDRRTGLVWQRCSHGQQVDARQGCRGIATHLSFAAARALEDAAWRLPRTDELAALFAPGQASLADPAAFPNAPQAAYWAVDAHQRPAVWGGVCAVDRDDSCTRTNELALRLVRRAPRFGPAGK